MTAQKTTPRKHAKVSNTAFARMTGIKWVCMDCGQTSLKSFSICPGKRPDPAAKGADQ